MKNIRIALEIYEGNVEDLPPVYQQVSCHIIFDVKMRENLRCNEQMVAGGNNTTAPSSTNYSSVVSRYSVRIPLTVHALNNLRVLMCNIRNAYLTTKCREKIWTLAGLEIGTEQGKFMFVVRELYGMNSSGASFRSLIAKQLHDLGYRQSISEPAVWMRPAVIPGGFIYYD